MPPAPMQAKIFFKYTPAAAPVSIAPGEKERGAGKGRRAGIRYSTIFI